MRKTLTRVTKNDTTVRNPEIFSRDCYRKKGYLKKEEQHTESFVCNDPRNT